MNDFNWGQIRSFNNSQNNAFEELVCQLARQEYSDSNTQFIRKGNPDAGVECFCILDNKKEIVFQAKYFLSSLQDKQWQEVDKSVKTLLEKHPNTTKCIIAIPIDPPDGRLPGEKSMLQKWQDRNIKWKKWANEKGMDVEYIPWWSSNLITLLQKPSNAGMLKFWFDKQEFFDEWFTEQIEGAVEDLGERYTPKLNFELNLSKVFDGIYGSEFFKKQFDSQYGKFQATFNNFFYLLDEKLDEYKIVISRCMKGIHSIYENTNFNEMEGIDCYSILCYLNKLEETLFTIQQRIENNNIPAEQNVSLEMNTKKYKKLSLLSTIFSKIEQFRNFINSETVKLFNLPILILEGEAGSGKSHLVADTAIQRNLIGVPSILLLGQHFTRDQNPWKQILDNSLGLNCNETEFLGALNAKAQSKGSRIIIYIDALNEGKGKYFWGSYIGSFIKRFKKYKWLGVVMTVRTSYVELIAPEDKIGYDKAIRLTHNGFSKVEHQASKLFFDTYEIEQPSIPLLHPEFTNPLFLKMFCEGLKKSGLRYIPDGYEGITTIMKFYLGGINKQLCHPTRMHYPETLNLVDKAVNIIVENKVNNSLSYIPYKEAYQLIEIEAKQYNIKSGLLEELISEGILIKSLFQKNDNETEEGIHLVYERFEDHLIAAYLIDKHLDRDKSYTSFNKDSILLKILKDDSTCYLNKGIIEALCVQVPEKMGKELYDLVPYCKSYDTVIECFIDSLIWRDKSCITEKSNDYINEYVVKNKKTLDQFFEKIISVTSNPAHYYNADFLHQYLKIFSLADRDASWTKYLHSHFHESSAVKRLVDWANSSHDKDFTSDESIRLVAKTLSWFLVSSNRPLRDAATKSLVMILKNRVSILINILEEFMKIDDSYVHERLYAVAYGCTLRIKDESLLKSLSLYIFKTIFNGEEVYPHILLRDYARGVIEFTLSKQIKLDINIEKIRPPYKSTWNYLIPTIEEIKSYLISYKISKDDDSRKRQNETVQPSPKNPYAMDLSVLNKIFFRWEILNKDELSFILIKRVFDLGYDVKKHGWFESYQSTSLHSNKPYNKLENIREKYVWTGFHELLAKIVDKYPMKSRFYNSIDSFNGPWNPDVRDIDPSICIQNIKESHNTLPPQNHWWFNTEYTEWEYSHREWLNKKDDLPHPPALIEVTDLKGNEWLVLESHPQWAEIEEDIWTGPNKRLSYDIHSYIVSENEYKGVLDWAKYENSMGEWKPTTHTRNEIYYREYFWSFIYKELNGFSQEYSWKSVNNIFNKPIGKIHITTQNFLWNKRNDCSIDEAVSFLLPSELIFNNLDMNFSGNEAEFTKNGKVVCFDPSVYNVTHPCLLIDKKEFLNFLKKNKLKIYWSVTGKKIVNGVDIGPGSDLGWLQISGLYTIEKNNGIKGSLKYLLH
ncbi:hypothetical protein [Priestia aryabhattai]|uniref:hypothetical protein n=1 Tax=Priestia aryabhattai TaxID=412384 RepID=UPI003D7EE808